MKKYIIGAVAGFMLSLGVSAHAEVVNMIGKAIDGSFPIKINGKTLTNQALTIEGVSYVPTREFAESLGAEVKFNADLGIEVVPLATPTPTPTASDPTPTTPDPATRLTKEQLQLQIELTKEDIELFKRNIIMGQDLPENVKEKIKNKLAEKEAELADLQAQLDALQK